MIKRIPITRARQLEALDPDEILEGYYDGRGGEQEPGNNRSFSYWHGWRNGRADRLGVTDDAQKALVKDWVRQMKKGEISPDV